MALPIPRNQEPRALGAPLFACSETLPAIPHGRLRHYLARLLQSEFALPRRFEADAEDLVQDTLLIAIERRDRFRGQSVGEFLAWIRVILRNRICKLLRSDGTAMRQRRTFVPLEQADRDGAVLLPIYLVRSIASPEEHAQLRELLEDVQSRIIQLPPVCQEVLYLHGALELSFAEVGLLIGLSSEACRKLWTRSLRKLGPIPDPEANGSQVFPSRNELPADPRRRLRGLRTPRMPVPQLEERP